MKFDFFKIRAAAPLKHSHPGFDSFVGSMEKLVKETIPESVIEMHETSQFIPLDSNFDKLNQALPILSLSEETDAPCTLSVTTLVREEHAHGIALFLSDMISHKLFPGKKMPITFLRSLTFKFIVKPNQRFHIIEFFIEVKTIKELYAIKKNFPLFEEEVRLTILGVEHARKVILSRGHSLEEKRMILSENLESLIKNPKNGLNKTLFSDVQTLLLQALYDHNPDKVPDHILPYIEENPETFDHQVFKEIENFAILFHESFASFRALSHLSKAISYLYLFRKILAHTTRAKPHERHLSLKLLSIRVKEAPTVAVLIGVNLIDPNEVLEVNDVLSSLTSIVPRAKLLPGSNVIDEEGKEGIRLLYFEVQKEEKSSFIPEELKALKKRLPKEIKGCIHVPKIPHAGMNEEKMRGILSLSKELSSVHDPAQVIIQFHNASAGHYDFSVILARVRKANEPELELSSIAPVTVRKQERKVAGILDQRFIKEIYLFEIMIQRDSRDIAKARSDLYAFLRSQVRNLRDYNGGMVSRKYENLQALKTLLEDPHHDSLIEHYFYGISPPFLQSLTPPNVLKIHFELFLKALGRDFLVEQTHILKEEIGNYTLIAIASADEREVERIRAGIPLGNDGIAIASMKTLDLHLFGLILPKSEVRIVEILDDLTQCV